MDSFLSELGQDGEHDSRGVFTVDVTKAKLKLAEFQLASFSAVSKVFISFAVTAEATQLTSRQLGTEKLFGDDTRRSIVVLDDLLLTPKDIEVVGYSALGGNSPKHLRYLATLLSTMASRSTVHLMSGESECELSIMFSGETIEEVEPTEHFQSGKTTFVIGGHAVHKYLENDGPNWSLWCPCRLQFGSTPLPQGVSLKTSLSSALGVSLSSDMSSLVHPMGFNEELIKRREDTQIQPHFLAYTEQREANLLGLKLIVDGIPYDIEAPPGICGVVVADHLTLDISYQNLRVDGAYQNAMDALNDYQIELMDQVLSRPRSLTLKDEADVYEVLLCLEAKGDVSHLKAMLQKATECVLPTVESEQLRLLHDYILRAEKKEQDRIIDSFSETVRKLWRRGSPKKAREYLKARTELQCNLERDLQHSHLLEYLFQVLFDHRAYTWSSSQGPRHYVQSLGEWHTRNLEDIDRTEYPEIHPSWFFPLEIEHFVDTGRRKKLAGLFETVPPWLELYCLVVESRFQDAIQFIDSRNELGPAWYGFLLAASQGRVSWADQIGLRARYSMSCLNSGADRLGFSKRLAHFKSAMGLNQGPNTGGALRTHMQELVRGRSGQPTFWPDFLATVEILGRRSGRENSRFPWLLVLAHCLLQELMSEGQSDPLARPVIFPGQR